MGLLQRLLVQLVTRSRFRISNGSKAVNISATMLRECIDRGSAGPDGPRRARLPNPLHAGIYLDFPTPVFNDLECFDELESLALITVVHGKLFGQQIGSLLVHDALRDHRATPSSLVDGPQAPRIIFAGWTIAPTRRCY